ncbi:hypothetical protein GCM10027605_36970 [Micromonospora zhanjiangensis]
MTARAPFRADGYNWPSDGVHTEGGAPVLPPTVRQVELASFTDPTDPYPGFSATRPRHNSRAPSSPRGRDGLSLGDSPVLGYENHA